MNDYDEARVDQAPADEPRYVQPGDDAEAMWSDVPELEPPIEESGAEHVSELWRGAWMVKWAVNLFVVVVLVSILVGAVAGATAASGGRGGAGGAPMILVLQIATNILTVAALVLGLMGWWKLSRPDPVLGSEAQAEGMRKFARIAIGFYAAVATVQAAASVALLATGGGGGSSGGTAAVSALGTLVLAFMLATLVALALHFVSAMLYVRRLAPRIGDRYVYDRALTLSWLNPLLSTFGLVLLGLGPLIALVLYYKLIARVGRSLRDASEIAAGAEPA